MDTARIEAPIRRISGLADSTHVLVEADGGVYVSEIGSTEGSRLLGQWSKEKGGFLSVSSASMDSGSAVVIADYKSMRVSYFDRDLALTRVVLLRPNRLTDSVAVSSGMSAYIESAPGTSQYSGAVGSLRAVSSSGASGSEIARFATVARRVANAADLVGVARYAEFQPMLTRSNAGKWIIATSDSFDVRFVSPPSTTIARFVGASRRQEFPKSERDSVVVQSLKRFGKHAAEFREYVDERLVGRRDSFQLLRRIRAAGDRVYAERFRACADRSVWLVLDTPSSRVSTLSLPSNADVIESPGSLLYVTWADTVGWHFASVDPVSASAK